MKNFILFQKSVTRRSPLAPLQKGGKYLKVFLFKERHCARQVSRFDTSGVDLRGSLNVATYSRIFPAFSNQAINFSWVLILATLISTPATAHKIETHKDVGATIHIEPNDAPRAGETALTWFALTQKGGEIIPLNECNCKLALYSQTRTEGTPLQQLPLKAVSQERYKGIPGAEITFPAAGAYQLQLQGTPKAGAKFSPFELKFDVNVAPGVATPKNSDRLSNQIAWQVVPPEAQTNPPWLIPTTAIGVIFIGAIAFVVWRSLHSNSTKKD